MAKKRGTKAGIEGGKELAKKFNEISKDVENDIEQALLESALMVERDAKKNAPVDTGRLRASISSRLVEESGTPYAEVGTNVSYAIIQEFGSSKQPAQPFLYPAYAENKQKILKKLAKAFKKGVGL